ncbi:MAG: hypothetical protein Q4G04_05770 [bacterium]|nr:hypothetical protein [bacterium]
MFERIFIFLLGFGLMIIGCTYIILYLNLFSMGYNFLDFVNFIIRRGECYFLLIGLILILSVIYTKGAKKI